MEDRFYKPSVPIHAKALHEIQRNLNRFLLDQRSKCGEVRVRDLSKCSDGLTKLATVMSVVKGITEGGLHGSGGDSRWNKIC